MNREDENVLKAIKRILDSGNNAEVKRDKNGNLKVFEVKKHIVHG